MEKKKKGGGEGPESPHFIDIVKLGRAGADSLLASLSFSL